MHTRKAVLPFAPAMRDHLPSWVVVSPLWSFGVLYSKMCSSEQEFLSRKLRPLISFSVLQRFNLFACCDEILRRLRSVELRASVVELCAPTAFIAQPVICHRHLVAAFSAVPLWLNPVCRMPSSPGPVVCH